ncbi:p27 [Tomato infectious chlorosis virus]|uniref:p26 n=1 Tax=Tomato infectious chlorosis virus TaxID=52135 RepID=C0K284_9CLOS|nr:p27 [Tomato infectious chlorosis virus]ACN87743.1 p26 [Tomato infectious chlorosis virus]ACN87751.1 p26 [Tomato infectious chlorosis virus]ACS73881.1 p27 [Tomato infectious chlorosis virus]WRK24213.1 26 kDa protein [Tomato infectious chlorosis virus]BBF90604.1 p27 protein [Tomato infectious chlorosis virus]
MDSPPRFVSVDKNEENDVILNFNSNFWRVYSALSNDAIMTWDELYMFKQLCLSLLTECESLPNNLILYHTNTMPHEILGSRRINDTDIDLHSSRYFQNVTKQVVRFLLEDYLIIINMKLHMKKGLLDVLDVDDILRMIKSTNLEVLKSIVLSYICSSFGECKLYCRHLSIIFEEDHRLKSLLKLFKKNKSLTSKEIGVIRATINNGIIGKFTIKRSFGFGIPFENINL